MSLSMLALSPVSIGCQKKVNYTILWGDAGTSKTRSTGNRSWWCWDSQCDQWDQQVISICPQNNIDFSLLIFHMLEWLTVRSAVVWCKFSLWELLLHSWHSSKSWLYNFCSDIFVSNVQMHLHLLWQWCVSQQVYTSSKLLTIHTSITFWCLQIKKRCLCSFYLLWNQFLVHWLKNCELFFFCADCQSSSLHCP
jgi:hypothetical protein